MAEATEIVASEVNLDPVMEQKDVDVSLVTTSSGAIVKARSLPQNLIFAMRRQNPPPRIPIVHIVDPSGKEYDEANPTDPVYLQSMEDYEMKIGAAFTDLMMIAGMRIVELPPDVEPYDPDGEWVEELESVGLDIPSTRTGRRIFWLKYLVMPSQDDITAVSEAYSRVSGVSEEEIEEERNRFRREIERRTSSGLGEGEAEV